MNKVTLEAPDITCDHCIASIRKVVTQLPSVQFLEGDPDKKQVTLEYDPAAVKMEAVEQAMEEEGYPVKK
ncbi:MAG: heavy-metal-associated domain-containing protein [Dehalococcoidia bacterium]